MKVITSGKDNRVVTCGKCRCVFEFDERDVQKYDLRDDLFSLFIPSTAESKIEYVECPECGHIETINRLNKRKEITEDDYSIRVFKDKD